MTTSLLLIFAGIYGAILGSFLNVVAVRDGKRKTILTGRSQCPHCHHTLHWYELVPIFSFLFQGARCLSCKKPISWRYPAVEAVTALLTIGITWYAYYLQGSIILTICLLVSFYLLLVISLIDLTSMEIPIEYVVLAGIVGGVGEYFSGMLSLQSIGLGILVGGGIIAAISYGWKFFFKQEGMGEGDIWLAAALGAITGFPLIILAIGLASIIGAMVGVMALAKHAASLETRVPFGPFLCVGALLVLYWGQALLRWYIL